MFSEIYYPRGWQVTIDGEAAEMLRVNYTLRALPVPAGEHIIVFRFDPQSIRVTDTIAFGALIIMLLSAVYLIFRSVKQQRKQTRTD